MPKKPHVKVLRDAIAVKLGIKTRRIYEKAAALATQAQTKTEDGLYLLAAQSHINLNKYLPRDRVAEIRNLLFQLNRSPHSVHLAAHSSRGPIPRTVTFTVGMKFALTDPLLTPKTLAEAKQMSEEVYPLLYIFENSMREFILRVMHDAHGSNWWNLTVPKKIRDAVEIRKAKEEQNPWHGKRGAQAIYYTDLDHLGLLVQDNWKDFKTILPSAHWLAQRLDEISHSRNPVAHMNPLSKHDIQRIKVYFRDWQNLITAKRGVIPHG